MRLRKLVDTRQAREHGVDVPSDAVRVTSQGHRDPTEHEESGLHLDEHDGHNSRDTSRTCWFSAQP
jgi:hypothetical protein